MDKPTCSVSGCPRGMLARGYCAMHYQRWKKYGTTDDPRPTLEERFWSKVNKDGPVPECRSDLGPCWVWTGSKSDGYGRFAADWNTRRGPEGAHRVSYRMVVGPIPDGLTIDHLCRNRACVNPAHLEAVTMRENVLRGNTVSAVAASRTHCPQGHAYTPENTYRYKDTGHRVCRTCNREHARKRYASRARDRAFCGSADGDVPRAASAG